VICAMASACPGRNKRNLGPPKLELPADGDSQARSRFEMSRSQFERDGEVDNSAAFEAIVREFPSDPIVPHALLYGAMADLRVDDAASALSKLDELKSLGSGDEMLLARASVFRGFALANLDRAAEALSDLRIGYKALNRGDDDEMSYWHAAMAEGSAATQKFVDAIVHYDGWYHYARESERGYTRDRVSTLVSSLADAQLAPLFAKLKFSDGPGTALVGDRYAAYLRTQGDDEGADSILGKVAAAQKAMGLGGLAAAASGAGNPDALGALLPLSGRLNRVGELSMRGLALASNRFPGAPLGQGGMSDFNLIARDTSSQLGSVATGVNELANEDVLAVVGPFDGRAVSEAGGAARALGLPIVSLAPRGGGGPGVFAIRHSAEDRARSLARHAYGLGVRDFAIFGPSTKYGSAVGKAFRSEVESLGGTIVVQASYEKGTTSFKADLKKIKKPWSAVFVPDQAKSLQLIAPALAAANMNAKPYGGKSKRGRSILLLSTAEGIEQGYLRSAGRYSLGAVFAPGYFSDRTDPQIADFVARYEVQFGSEPSAHEAYAYDAAAAIRHAVDGGVQTSGQLLKALFTQSMPGLTGTVQFGPDGKRDDAGLLFEVQEPIPGQYQLKALR
jgi:ABC-type branched-subunit amino acid transport system substrate-binding protein